MRKVLAYSLLLIAGLVVSQVVGPHAPPAYGAVVKALTMLALSFIMIHVGYEFELDKSRPRQYAWDYAVAAGAASVPWLLCAAYFVFVMSPPAMWGAGDAWREGLLKGLFAAPTSAGVLFSMLAAAGLGATWVFAKARVLAIFDDLHTILLLIPMTAVMTGLRVQLVVTALFIVLMLWLAWRYLNAVGLPVTWPWVLLYSAVIVTLSETVYFVSHRLDPQFPIHLEVLLPAFALGCVMRTPPGQDPHSDDAREGVEEGPEQPREQFVSTIVSALFMVLVGLSMPSVVGGDAAGGGHAAGKPVTLTYDGVPPEALAGRDRFPGWGMIALHVLAVTVLSNVGKMVPAVCYRAQATARERLALAVGMFPRGEVGAGVLLISLSYGLGGPTLTVAVLSLALNLLCTGLFIMVVKRLLKPGGEATAATPALRPSAATEG